MQLFKAASVHQGILQLKVGIFFGLEGAGPFEREVGSLMVDNWAVLSINTTFGVLERNPLIVRQVMSLVFIEDFIVQVDVVELHSVGLTPSCTLCSSINEPRHTQEGAACK